MKAKPCVAYYRVSTSKQGINGLGMEAQQAAVREFLSSGKSTELIGEFSEVESGKRKNRPELEKAIALCRKAKARLVIAKLDRLARNAAFTLALRDSGVDFVAADMPDANKLTIGIMALIAEDERDRISARTKAALAQAKRRGVQLGNPKLSKARALATKAKQREATRFARELEPVVEEIIESGVKSHFGIARCLNRRGYKTPTGKEFRPQSVKNLIARITAELH